MQPDILNIAAIPIDIAIGDKEANINAAESAIASLQPGTDLVVLPELFSTGYPPDHDAQIELSETVSGPTIERLLTLARQHNVAIAGTYLARVGGQLRNRAFFLEPSGEESYYDKAHLFSISRESQDLHPGRQRAPIVRFRGWNIYMIICYDLRFPVWCRTLRNDYDLMLVPANWPECRTYAWRQLLIARAIENQAYVVGANRGGEDEWGTYPQSTTQIFDFMGQPIGTSTPGGAVRAALDRSALQAARSRMPIADDSDTFSIINQ